VCAVRDFLLPTPAAVAPETVARGFLRARTQDVTAIPETWRLWDKPRVMKGDFTSSVRQRYFLLELATQYGDASLYL
jgi:hypothetical protein